jgi:hypothetical protein
MNLTIVAAVLAIASVTALSGCSESESGEASSPTATTSTKGAAEVSATAAARSSAAAASSSVAAAAEAARQAAAAAAAAAEAARMDKSTYPAISSRDYQIVVRDPAAHIGRKMVVYGRVTQYDAATGLEHMLARTDANEVDVYDYDINTMLEGTRDTFAPVVEDDLITIYADVIGSYSYDTQAGGNTTVPKLRANMVEVTGTAK